MTHAEINNAVRKLAYLKTPDKVRAGVRNMYGVSVSLERVERILSALDKARTVRGANDEPLDDDAFDYDYRINPNSRAPRVIQVTPRTGPVFKQREPLPEKVPVSTPNPFTGPFEFKRLAASIGQDFRVTADDIIGPKRFRTLILPRLVLTKLCIERGMSCKQIGRKMGGRDHSTILHQRDKFDAYAALYPAIAASYARHVALREEANAARESGV